MPKNAYVVRPVCSSGTVLFIDCSDHHIADTNTHLGNATEIGQQACATMQMSARLANSKGKPLDLEPFFFFDQVGKGTGPLPPAYGHAQAMAVSMGAGCPPAPQSRGQASG